MTIKIDADTSSGLQLESDTSGIIDIQSAGVTKMTVGTTIDIQGNELVLDADADTSIHADTDDQIDFKIGGTDVGKIDSNGIEGASLVKLAGETLSADASSIEISASTLTTSYKNYEIYADLQPKTDGQQVFLRLRDNTGTILNTVSDFQMQAYRGGGTDFSDTTMSALTSITGVGNASDEHAVCRFTIGALRDSAKDTQIIFQMSGNTTAGSIFTTYGSFQTNVAEDNQGIQLTFASGDIASGSSYVLYGVKS